LLIGAEAFLYGYSYPFFSLALEKRELANWLIGLNASLANAGILFVGPFLPRLIDRYGLKYVVAAMFVVPNFTTFASVRVSLLGSKRSFQDACPPPLVQQRSLRKRLRSRPLLPMRLRWLQRMRQRRPTRPQTSDAAAVAAFRSRHRSSGGGGIAAVACRSVRSARARRLTSPLNGPAELVP
jgi:MFS family permease